MADYNGNLNDDVPKTNFGTFFCAMPYRGEERKMKK